MMLGSARRFVVLVRIKLVAMAGIIDRMTIHSLHVEQETVGIRRA
jgi:hypothetical protein